jgi:glycine/D-amino acid oxidase-like deaminating enzyme
MLPTTIEPYATRKIPSANGIQRALVVGGGIFGLSVAWALARRGVQIDLFEQGSLPNPLSSSHDEHRIIRHAYGHLHGYARMMPDAYRVWDLMWKDFGVSHYEESGTIYLTRNDDGWFEASVSSLDELGIRYRELPPALLAEQFPMIEPQGIRRAMRVDRSGILYPQRIMADLLSSLTRSGVRLRAASTVSEIDPDRATLVVHGETKSADVVVIAAGAWMERLLSQFRGIAVPSRQTILYLAPPSDLLTAWTRAPPLLMHNLDRNLYSLPPRSGTRLKVGDHQYSRTGDVDLPRQPSDTEVSRLWQEVRASFRSSGHYAVMERKSCFYTLTDDERFHVRQVGAQGWGISACSGHGFKLAPLIAEGVAQAIVGEIEAGVVSDWAAGRGPTTLRGAT